jgi:hypothetical protein
MPREENSIGAENGNRPDSGSGALELAEVLDSISEPLGGAGRRFST